MKQRIFVLLLGFACLVAVVDAQAAPPLPDLPQGTTEQDPQALEMQAQSPQTVSIPAEAFSLSYVSTVQADWPIPAQTNGLCIGEGTTAVKAQDLQASKQHRQRQRQNGQAYFLRVYDPPNAIKGAEGLGRTWQRADGVG